MQKLIAQDSSAAASRLQWNCECLSHSHLLADARRIFCEQNSSSPPQKLAKVTIIAWTQEKKCQLQLFIPLTFVRHS